VANGSGLVAVGWVAAVGAEVVSAGAGSVAEDAGDATSELIVGTAVVGAEPDPAEAAVAPDARTTAVKVIPVPTVRTICGARLRRGLRMR
jgi:hypothetical protein